jgi:hypothetical protein
MPAKKFIDLFFSAKKTCRIPNENAIHSKIDVA